MPNFSMTGKTSPIFPVLVSIMTPVTFRNIFFNSCQAVWSFWGGGGDQVAHVPDNPGQVAHGLNPPPLPVNRRADTSENITFPCALYVIGNKT